MSRAWALAGLVAVLVIMPVPASADPAGPTDYETIIVAVDPPTEGISVRMLGGDSFIELTAEPGTEVLVVGYRGEPYLWFAPDGTVSQNTRSESTYLNEDRYAEAAVPDDVDNDAEPRWQAVADDGRYAWHDHRTHWMNPDPPPAAEPGDTILEATVPLDVDGEPTVVAVRSTLVDPPSPWAASLGAVVGMVVAGAAARVGGTRAALVVLGAAALVVGVWERISMPPEAAASALVFLLPTGALVFAGLARPPVTSIAASFSAAQLVAWALLRWPVLTKPVLPTDAPWPLDRFVTTMVLAGSVGCFVLAARRAVGDFRAQP